MCPILAPGTLLSGVISKYNIAYQGCTVRHFCRYSCILRKSNTIQNWQINPESLRYYKIQILYYISSIKFSIGVTSVMIGLVWFNMLIAKLDKICFEVILSSNDLLFVLIGLPLFKISCEISWVIAIAQTMREGYGGMCYLPTTTFIQLTLSVFYVST